MKTSKVVFLVFLSILSICAFDIQLVKSQSSGTIYIRADGTVLGTDKIQRDGNLYRLTSNLYDSPIVVLCNNIVLEGEGFVLQGAGGWGTPGVAGVEATSAINLTCSNVTVRNFSIVGWEVGILGAYNSNTISSNNITGTKRAIAIYADNYGVTGNYLANSICGVRIKGNSTSISQNEIVNNFWGILISSSSGLTITENNIANNICAVNIDNVPPSNYQIYHNNFINGVNSTIVTTALDAFPGFPQGGTLPPWDNGSEGNYWSDYTTKYPNATEIDHTGIGNTPYLIRINPTVIDRYPLIRPVAIQNVTLPLPSSTPPSISTLSPQNKTYTTADIPLTFKINETVTWIRYCLDRQANVTITGNTTLTGLSNGLHNLTVYAKDAFENVGASETVYFTIAKPEPFPTTLVVASVVSVVVVGAGLLVYFKKRKR